MYGLPTIMRMNNTTAQDVLGYNCEDCKAYTNERKLVNGYKEAICTTHGDKNCSPKGFCIKFERR